MVSLRYVYSDFSCNHSYTTQEEAYTFSFRHLFPFWAGPGAAAEGPRPKILESEGKVSICHCIEDVTAMLLVLPPMMLCDSFSLSDYDGMHAAYCDTTQQ